jgi:hypothetical protein
MAIAATVHHAIVAIATREPPPESSVLLEHGTLGRLVMFDPTDEHTPLGELPADQQGSLALVLSPGVSGLDRLPVAAQDRHKIERTIEGALDARGALKARMREHAYGAMAAEGRAVFKALDPSTYREWLQRRLALFPALRILDSKPRDTETEFEHTVEFESAAYGQSMGILLLLKPAMGLGEINPSVVSNNRRRAIVVQPTWVEETVRLNLPSGFSIDELPAAVSSDTRTADTRCPIRAQTACSRDIAVSSFMDERYRPANTPR